jgi:Putative peptidoglycan binding domain
MRKICTFGIVVTASFLSLQSAEAGSRGGGRSFASAPHFSGAHFSAPARHYSGPGRNFSSAARFYGPARFSSGPALQNRTYLRTGPRFSSTTALRNPAYSANRARFSGDRTTAFNTRGTARVTAGRTGGLQSQAFDRGRVVARHPASWHRNWDRSRDHFWHGRRCHFHNNFWVFYDPFFWDPYLYGYGYYPYSSYYDDTNYDDGSAPTEDSPAPYTNQPENDTGSRVSDVQSALAREGYYDGPIDGRLGNATRKALRRYQSDHGLDVTGAINRAVIEALQLR